MKSRIWFVGIGVTTLVGVWAGCSSNSGGAGAGVTTTHSTSSGTGGTVTSSSSGSASTSSGSTTTATGTAGAGTGGMATGAGGGPANFSCTIPTPPPSGGSCVTFVPGDAGEIDAGVDDAGDPSITNCNPVTNAGCTGTDICGPDYNSSTNKDYFCQAAGSMANVPVCGNCTSLNATCAGGGICVELDQTGSCSKDSDCPSTEFCDTTNSVCADAFCAQMCCTNADCGSTGMCNTMALGLPSGVGICVPM